MWPEQKVSNAIRDFLQPKIFCDHNNCFNKTYSNYFTIAHRNVNKMRISCRKWLVRTGLVYISLMFEFGIVLLCLITSVKSSVGPSAVSIVSLKCLSSPKNRCGFQNGQRCRAWFLLQWYDSSNCGQCLLYLMAQTTTLFLFLTLEYWYFILMEIRRTPYCSARWFNGLSAWFSLQLLCLQLQVAC